MVLLRHPAAGWEIRPHTRDDASGILSVFEVCLDELPRRKRKHASEFERLRYLLRTSTIPVAVEPSAGLIGFMVLQADAGYVSHLFVDPDWRFCGVASGLLNVGRSISGKRLCLDVDMDNPGALQAYERIGFQQTISHGLPGGHQKRLFGP